ncbi:MAG: hypothetical protein AAF992_12320 [Bacteroidota bacterium]
MILCDWVAGNLDGQYLLLPVFSFIDEYRGLFDHTGRSQLLYSVPDRLCQRVRIRIGLSLHSPV